MYRETIRGDWEREPIFPATGATRPDGTVMAYFCHVVHRGEVVATVFAEALGEGAWQTWVEENGDEFHAMRETYPTFRAAIDDMVDWYTGQ